MIADTELARIAQTLRSLTPRGEVHVFLGDPHSDGCDKTTVEPGNVFSPGVWTCGISAFVADGDRLFTAETTKPDEITWELGTAERFSPVLHASWPAGYRVAWEK